MAKRKRAARKPARKKTRKIARKGAYKAARRRKKATRKSKITEMLGTPSRAAALLWGEPMPVEKSAGEKKD